jgi:hypothetical protein
MSETYHYRVVYVWNDGEQSATVPFENLDYARKLRARATASGDLARCYIERRLVGEWTVTDQSAGMALPLPRNEAAKEDTL